MRKKLLSVVPYRHTTISTSLTLDEVVELFSKSISPLWNPIFQAPPPNHTKCQGKVTADGFRIRMTDYYRGSSTYLAGKFIPDINGVKIEMHIDPGLGCLILVFGGIVGFCALLGAIAGKDLYAALIVGSILLVLGGSFYFETDSLDWFIGNMLEKYII